MSVSAQQLPEVLTSYFYFYVCFRATTAVVDGGDIFGIWRGGGGEGGVLRVLIGGSEPEWEMRRIGWGDRWGALCTGFTLVCFMG